MPKQINVLSIFGTRPEAIKMAPLAIELNHCPYINHKICVTAQHRQLLDQVLQAFQIRPDFDLDIMKDKQTLESITTSALNGISRVLREFQPDIVLVHGDTSTTFASALSSFYEKTVVGHVEAGLRTYNQYSPFPEEMNRQLTSRIAGLHFAPTLSNKLALQKENITDNIYVTGNTIIDAMRYTVRPSYQFVNKELYALNLNAKRLIVMTAHRRENLGEPLSNICRAVKRLTQDYPDVEIVYPVHPNPAVRDTVFAILKDVERVHLIDPIDVEDMHNLMARAYIVMTDSGGLQEEAPSLGKPVLVMRTETERPEAVASGTVKLVGIREEDIYQAAQTLLTDSYEYERMAKAINPYGDGKASKRIVQAILYHFGLGEEPDEFSTQNIEQYEIKEITQISQNLESAYSLQEAKDIITCVQDSRPYKCFIFLRRIKTQLITGKWAEKKDFIKYVLHKLHLYKHPGKLLRSFDHLTTVRDLLDSANQFSITYEQGHQVNNKDGGQVFIFAGVPYYDIGAGQRCSQLAKVFDRMGFRVYYFYAFNSTEKDKASIFNPLLMHEFIDNIRVDDVLRVVEHNAVFIFEAPCVKFVPYLAAAKNQAIFTIYEHIDNWETSLGNMLYDRETFLKFIELTDRIAATSKELVKQLQAYTQKEISYIPNAVDVALFEPNCTYKCPVDLRIGKQKTLLYFGSLWGEWFDWDLLREVAIACPESTFNMIGDYAAIGNIIETLPKNIYFLGSKKQTSLPAYLAFSDIALLPFKNCDIGRYVSPLKIFEYIAMRKFVLATPLPDIIGYTNTLCSDKASDWIEAINQGVITNDATFFTDDNSWYQRCTTLIDMCNVQVHRPKPDKISLIILNYNNMPVIFRCINSLLKHNKRYHYEIVVVDNQSTDGSFERLKEIYGEQIVLVQNVFNGCASGRNLGVINSKGDVLVFLDSDQWVISDYWLDSALKLIDKYPGAGAISWAAGWFDFGRITGPVVENFENRAIQPHVLYREDIAYLGTGGMVLKRSVFNRLEGFDVVYDPTCFEDTDISFQIRNIGLKLMYCPYMGIMHLPHQTTKSGEPAHDRLFQKNGAYFVKKWTGKNKYLLDSAWKVKPSDKPIITD